MLQATINIGDRADEISLLTEFSPTIEGYIRIFLFIAALAAFGYLLWGGLDWILAGGDSGKVENARKKVTHAVIGLVILFSAALLFMIVQSFLGFSIIS